MNEEIHAIEKNNTWELTTLPKEKKPIGVKWMYKTKYKLNGEVESYKARLVAKGYTQKSDLGLMSYFLGIEVKQTDKGIFISQKKYDGDILKKFKMEACNSILRPAEERLKLMKY
ncbi:hypothetical protein RJ639_042257 [Escallonia herrerae]|uniref:Reverse transcriptase Ty1/copia-type domain-containing protein n=1 Tax=Escallonia herrerae TaxID=1293975 RepID=A0AA89B4S6_9ASTE|nr:hypothetical protein RJ639_042257 [Escallonia herrerae]